MHSTGVGETVDSLRELLEYLMSGVDDMDALMEAADALKEAIAGHVNRPDRVPVPSLRLTGEHQVAVLAETAAKAAQWMAQRESGTSRVALAARLGIDEEAVR